MAFSLDVPTSSTLLHFLWPFLRPVGAPFLVRPEIKQRLKDYDIIKAAKEEPDDFLRWSIDQAKTLEIPIMGKSRRWQAGSY